MCDTKNGLELTRLSLVDGNGFLLLDMYVRPALPITDYRSQWSGVTADIMDNVTHTLQEAQVALLRLVPKETILVGHSLDSDLRAMRVSHCLCIDTAVLYPHPKKFPYRNSLRFLASTYLNLTIQANNGSGHSSIEDARTAMQLVNLKVEKGPSFGVPKASSRCSIFTHMSGCCSSLLCWTNDEDWRHMKDAIGLTTKVFIM
jgi:RNA exonuclease 1